MKNKASTQKEFRRLVETIIKPNIGHHPVASITRGDISAFHHRLRETPRQANHVLSVLSKMFNLAEVWGFRPDGSNPCRLIERYEEVARERFLSDAEAAEIGKALSEMEETGEASAPVSLAIRLLMLTGCRLSEILTLRWDDVDLEDNAFRLRDAKAGARVHPIGSVTKATLTARTRVSEWVVPSRTKPSLHLSVATLEGAWKKVRNRAGLPDVRIHDLRHTVGTYAGQTGANAFLVRDKLGHKTLAMTGRYVSKDTDPLRDLSDRIEARIVGALDAGAAMAAGETDDEKVIPLPKPRERKPGR